jgi:nitrogen regulatory protein PII
MSDTKNDLIISIVNHGYSDEFMTTAREAGATGGTVLNARGLAHQGPVKFFGVFVQDEREIIIILTNREKKTPIMQAVSQAYGITTKAGGLIFSVPVDHVMGLCFE